MAATVHIPCGSGESRHDKGQSTLVSPYKFYSSYLQKRDLESAREWGGYQTSSSH